MGSLKEVTVNSKTGVIQDENGCYLGSYVEPEKGGDSYVQPKEGTPSHEKPKEDITSHEQPKKGVKSDLQPEGSGDSYSGRDDDYYTSPVAAKQQTDYENTDAFYDTPYAGESSNLPKSKSNIGEVSPSAFMIPETKGVPEPSVGSEFDKTLDSSTTEADVTMPGSFV